MSHKITSDKVREFLRRNGFDSMPIYATRDVCHINVSTTMSISVVKQDGATVAEIVEADHKDNTLCISRPFATMEDFTSYFLSLEV